jgi:hypothetical protein
MQPPPQLPTHLPAQPVVNQANNEMMQSDLVDNASLLDAINNLTAKFEHVDKKLDEMAEKVIALETKPGTDSHDDKSNANWLELKSKVHEIASDIKFLKPRIPEAPNPDRVAPEVGQMADGKVAAPDTDEHNAKGETSERGEKGKWDSAGKRTRSSFSHDKNFIHDLCDCFESEPEADYKNKGRKTMNKLADVALGDTQKMLSISQTMNNRDVQEETFEHGKRRTLDRSGC